RSERSEADPVVILTVRDSEGNTVRRIEGPVTKGFHRVSWDLRYPSPQAVTSADASSTASGMLAQPGQYTVTMSKRIDGVVTELSAPQSFDVVPLREGALPGASHADVAAFFRAYENAVGRNSVLDASLSEAMDTITKMEIALSRATGGTGDLDSRIHDAKQGLLNLRADVYGPPARQEPGERVAPTVGSRLSVLDIGLVTSTYGPTQTHKEQLQIVNEHLAGFESTLSVINESLTGIRIALRDAGVLFVE
ncbi:MAG: glycosyl hydrolase, partial [Bacteroidetes Order II. Incertae sedis bacterium]|nr:glycosyl hydrolase [Bacteroidetes Order II. bacterium]